MRFFPYVAAFIGGMLGWKLGQLAHHLMGVFLAIIGSALAFYYARRYQKELLG